MNSRCKTVGETRAQGARLAGIARAGQVFVLEGDLGAGKTEFVRGFMAAISPSEKVRSPSFSILNVYESERFPVYHFDFYRLADPSELVEIGFGEYVSGEGVCIIEWGTMFPQVLPPHALIISFIDDGDGCRTIGFPDETA
jgi:tRNA threonylcarbamoyladenosine biosynthesis protein TsaE